jgi:hypothetical protein
MYDAHSIYISLFLFIIKKPKWHETVSDNLKKKEVLTDIYVPKCWVGLSFNSCLFSANKIKRFEFFSKQQTQLIIAADNWLTYSYVLDFSFFWSKNAQLKKSKGLLPGVKLQLKSFQYLGT